MTPPPPFHPSFSVSVCFLSSQASGPLQPPGGRYGPDTGLMNELVIYSSGREERRDRGKLRGGGMERVGGVGSRCRRSVT